VTKTANNTAAQANLQTALTGADTYYTSNNQTYLGIYGVAGVSGITAIDTGLTYSSGGTTTTSNTISLFQANSGSSLVMAAYAPGTKDCWVVVDMKMTVTATSAPTTTWPTAASYLNAGTYYGVIKADPNPCKASAAMGVSTWSSTGFPTG
jgi:hypothetical protein